MSLQRKKILLGSFIFISLYGAALTYAAMTYVAPSTVQDPVGAPGTYTVGFATAPNEVLYTNSSNQLASDAGFTRVPTMVDLPDQSIGNKTLTTMQNTANTNGIANVGSSSVLLINDSFDHLNAYTIGLAGEAVQMSSGTIDKLVGLGGVSINNGSGVVTQAMGTASVVVNSGSGSITNGYGFFSNKIDGTNKYGIYVDVDDTTNVLRELQLHDESPLKLFDKDSSNFIALKSPSVLLTDTTYTLPLADGSSGQFLKTDGAGNLSWDTPAGGGGSSDIQTATIHVSSAEILALNTSPVELLPAPGAGKAIDLVSLVVRQNFVTTQYDGGFMAIFPSLYFGVGNISDNISGTQLDFTSSRITKMTMNGLMVENEPLYLGTSANPTNGDGTLDFYITYRIIDL